MKQNILTSSAYVSVSLSLSHTSTAASSSRLDDLGARSDVQKATNDGQVLQRLDHLVRWRRDGVVDVNVEARGDEGKAEGQQHAEERAANAKNDEQGEGNEDRAGNLHKQNKVRIRQSV
eukprot:CAMPEP_0176418750 /NCGR_PEP_ID=MMETSP0127-20121128/7646_1 /TAXON_ID=938130 /ORGANISM="Platyophrya macrostoma, Strain WH" /LENGTH=118 /DNA_ID=CAMNT_0017799113 /DNA_START=362 /DNA_END=719 /DNA_ORIENTATION=+